MAREDDDKSAEGSIEEFFARITDGMDEEERSAVLRGYKYGMEATKDDLSALQAKYPNLGTVLLQGIETGLQDKNVQNLLAQHRVSGDSSTWLEEQISTSIQQMADIASGRPPSVSNPQTSRFHS